MKVSATYCRQHLCSSKIKYSCLHFLWWWPIRRGTEINPFLSNWFWLWWATTATEKWTRQQSLGPEKHTVSIKNQNPNHLIKNQTDKLDTHFSKGGTPQIACKYLEESMTAMLMRGRCGEIETYNNGRWGCKLMLLGLSLGKWVLVVPKKTKRTARWFSYSTPIRAPKNSKSANYIDSCTSIFTAIILTIGAVQNRPKTSFNT